MTRARRRYAWLIALFWGAAAAAQDIPVLESRIDGGVRALDLVIGAPERTGDAPVVWTGGISIPDTDYLRLLVRIEGPPAPPTASLYLFSDLGQEFIIPLADMPEGGHWTGLIPNGNVTIALYTPDPLNIDTTVTIENLSIQQDDVLLYSVHGEAQLWPIASPEVPQDVQALAGPVAFLSFFDAGLPRTCTGFLIEPDLLLTNEHCIHSQETCRTMTAVFGYQRDEAGRLAMGQQRRCTGYEDHYSSFDLDVTALRLSSPPGEEYGIIEIPDEPAGMAGPLMIIQHPGDLPKHVALLDCEMTASPVSGRTPDSDFTHTCDTASGSSGAPILNAAGQLVGVHHYGFQEAPDSLWRENRGVLAALVIPWLRALTRPQ
ncbi:trypsin-like serine peptidase [Roseovarius arcticus]|uniref:trypsin-like serine peptidase n=1 Tax=Roseovarius arcticus TaxID=2547404 RepID=UPI0011101F49|nr:serine protease [Roseovarius arcticus]